MSFIIIPFFRTFLVDPFTGLIDLRYCAKLCVIPRFWNVKNIKTVLCMNQKCIKSEAGMKSAKSLIKSNCCMPVTLIVKKSIIFEFNLVNVVNFSHGVFLIGI